MGFGDDDAETVVVEVIVPEEGSLGFIDYLHESNHSCYR
jgi:hypothetical protein